MKRWPSILPWENGRPAPFDPDTQALWIWWTACAVQSKRIELNP